VAVLGAARTGPPREGPDTHDWLEVTELTPLEPEPELEPVDVLAAPELAAPELAEPELAAPELAAPELAEPEPVEVVEPVVVVVAADWVRDLRASAGS
jgi:hypothetical protein